MNQASQQASQLTKLGSRVAFQGEHGAFSEEAAICLLGNNIKLVPQQTFDMLFSANHKALADLILAPLENSLMGTIPRCYDLLIDSSLQIVAEVILPISHYLIGCQGSSFADIKTVESHPAALAQCEDFFATNPQIRRVEADDTAGSVRRVIERGETHIAAIAGKQAALAYQAKILKEHLEDHSENYTRFVLLAPTKVVTPQLDCFYGDKLSLAISLNQVPGGIYPVLEIFAQHNIELLKIETRPLKGLPWQYRFYLDLQASLHKDNAKEALNNLKEKGYEIQLLGCYPKATSPKKIERKN